MVRVFSCGGARSRHQRPPVSCKIISARVPSVAATRVETSLQVWHSNRQAKTLRIRVARPRRHLFSRSHRTDRSAVRLHRPQPLAHRCSMIANLNRSESASGIAPCLLLELCCPVVSHRVQSSSTREPKIVSQRWTRACQGSPVLRVISRI
jgi:hypothetical protein